MAQLSPQPGMLELHNLVTAGLGITAILLGLLMMYRARVPGYGWTFPIAAFFSVSGVVDITHAISLVGTPAAGIVSPEFFKPSHRLLAEILVLSGLSLGLLRIRMGIITNSFLTWGWLLVIVALSAILIMWNLGTAVVDDHTLKTLISGSSHPMLWYYGPLSLVSAVIGYNYRRFTVLIVFAAIYTIGLLCNCLAHVVADSWMVVGNVIELLSYLLVYLSLIQSPADDAHALIARSKIRLVK